MTGKIFFVSVLIFLSVHCMCLTAFGLNQPEYVSFSAEEEAFPVVEDSNSSSIYIDSNDWPGVIRAAKDLQSDIFRVTGTRPSIYTAFEEPKEDLIIIGTIEKSYIIDRLIKEGKIDTRKIEGQWESFFLQVVNNPFPKVDRALVICGSDKRGTIFGIYDLSEQIGVSPLHWWADAPIEHQDNIYIKKGIYRQGPPSVKYRGIFLNDEAPNLSGWVQKTFGTVPVSMDPPIPEGVANYNSEFYGLIFETILRMKGNYLWPAMWNNAFNEDDPKTPKLADEYGIVMGTTHQEPMLRAQKEWDRRYQSTLGSWNYYNHSDTLKEFWREGIRRNRDYESIITLGLRGANDSPMIPGGTIEQNMELLEEIVSVQRKMIADEINPNVAEVPQLWCLYKEVQGFYNAGLRVPDDVTLLWSDDNWGNLRRLPTEEERTRTGGAGIYYHFDYVGGPRNYKWINTVSIPKTMEQMKLAKAYGADRIWIVNVGHFKHVLLPMEFFMNLAWNTDQWNGNNIDQFTKLWAEREFGPRLADDVADILDRYTRYNARRKPELLSPSTYSIVDHREAERVTAEFKKIVIKAEEIYEQLPEKARNLFYDMVLFPSKASCQVNEMYEAAAKNRLYAEQGRAYANDMAKRVTDLFEADANLMNYYNNEFAGGKWKHFMDQTHIGYTAWFDPPKNIMPKVTKIDLPEKASMGVAIEGSPSAWPGSNEKPILPVSDPFNRQRRYIEIFNRGIEPFAFSVKTKDSWVIPGLQKGTIEKQQRIWFSIDWTLAPKGSSSTSLIITGHAQDRLEIEFPILNPFDITPERLDGFIEGEGYVSMEAEHFTARKDSGDAGWKKVKGYGRTLSAMAAGPATFKSMIPPEGSPCLEYRMYILNPGRMRVHSYFSTTLNFNPDRGLRYAISFDDETPRILDIVPEEFDAQNGNREWEDSVRNSIRIIKSEHEVHEKGYHTLKIWMVDPAVVLEKIVVDTGGLKQSYLGPPESFSSLE